MAIDAERDYTPEDVLTCDDALSLAVLGYKVRAVDMQDGCYVDYNFNGWRINFEGGSSSGWSARKHDYAADWHVIDDTPKPVVPVFEMKPTQSVALNQQKWGRIPRALNVPAGAKVVVMDYGANPAEVLRQVSVGVAAEAALGVDHASFDRAAATMAEPVSAPNVGKWGKALPTEPKRDAWGRKAD